MSMEFLDTSFLKSDEVGLELEKTVSGDGDWLPTYHFYIVAPTGERVGVCDLRIGHSESVYYGGNIGYRVWPDFRGNRYAAKACILLFELARRHGMEWLYISCNPENIPSRRTCELAGGSLVAIEELPEDNDMRINDGETYKCIYRFEL